MYDPWIIVALVCLYMGTLFLIARWVEGGSSAGKRLANSPVVYSLALAVYCSSWTFFGSIGIAASSGLLFLAIYLGSTMAIVLWWFVLRKLVRIKTTHHITSIADFISARYGKSQRLGAIATLVALVGAMPYIALELKAVTSSFALIADSGGTANWTESAVGLIVVALMVVFTIIFGTRRLEPTERHEGMITALAVQGLVKLIAFLVVGVFVTYFLYDGFGDILLQLSESNYRNLMNAPVEDASAYVTWMSYLILGMAAVQFLPRQFHVAVVENSNEKHIRTAMWLFPLYMLLINIFVVPIAVGGLLQGHPVQSAEAFVLTLPLDHGQPWLTLLVFIGGFSAAAGMIIVNSMTIATMLSNHILLPLLERAKPLGFLRRHILRIRWAAVAGILIVGYWFERGIGDSHTLANMGMISFAAALQFAPSILGGLFWKRGKKIGAMLGLSAGFLIWAYTLLIPSFARSGWIPGGFIENGLLGIGLFKPEQLFGMTKLGSVSHTVFWSMLLNVGLYIVGSLYAERSREEQRLAETFVGALAIEPSTRFVAGESYIDLESKRAALENLLSQYFTTAGARTIMNRSLDVVGVMGQEHITAAELAELENEAEKSLAGSIGAAAAHQAVSQIELFTPAEAKDLSEVYGEILADLRVAPEELRRRIDFYQDREALMAIQAAELERKVGERTRDLETAAEVGRAAASILNPNQLIQQVVGLIRERFHFYYVGMFLVDETGEWAVLRAGTGKAGQVMLERGHRLKVGEGMVGWSIANDEVRVALDVGRDAVRRTIAELPNTRSEASLPLRSRGRVIGALSVQSDLPNAFDESTIVVLQTMADQVAVALDNARLFSASQAALDAERQAYGQVSRDAWVRMVQTRPTWGYRCNQDGVIPSMGAWQPGMEQAIRNNRTMRLSDREMPTIAIPIRVRGHTVGALNFCKADKNYSWTADEMTLLETLTEQLGNALESAQLYQDTQERAAREQLTSQVTARMRETLNVDTVLQTAVREMRQVLGLHDITIRLGDTDRDSPGQLRQAERSGPDEEVLS